MKFRPGRHWGFYGLIVLAGWIAPPVACLVRFGVGRDLLICTILTICGYFPGHIYNFYVQNIRNNNGRGRTPKWAVRYGLVKIKDPKSKPKHQWQNRYEERTAHRADGYEDSLGTSSPTDSWDGRGPMPLPKEDITPPNGRKKKGGLVSFLEPWNDEVDGDDIEGGPSRRTQRVTRQATEYGQGPSGLQEDFYNPPPGPSLYEVPSGLSSDYAKPSKLRTMVTGTTSSRHRGDTWTSAGPERGAGDRFSRMDGARRRRDDPNEDRRNGTGYYDGDAGDADPWSRSSDADPLGGTTAHSKPVRHSDDPLAHNF